MSPFSRRRKVRSVPRLPARARTGHKGDYGRVLVVGGSRGMVGAPALAANAALRGGAGLVTVGVPVGIQQTVAGLAPCATSVPLPETGAGLIAGESDALSAALDATDVVAFGPGLGHGDAELDLRWRDALVSLSCRQVVIDADGLNLLVRLRRAGHAVRPAAGWVLTPHPGEMARLLDRATADVQADRVGAAAECAERWVSRTPSDEPTVVVLKGAGSVVTDGRRVFVNRTGNPGMATGGSGDVLTGVIAALIGQGLSRYEAAVLGVHVHGLAGDIAARSIGRISLIATDLIDHLPQAFRTLSRRGRSAGRSA